MRGSNTEPIIRLVAESDTEERARAMLEDVRARVAHACAEEEVTMKSER